MTERGEDLLALWNELDRLTDQKDSIAVSTVLAVLTITLVLLGLDAGSLALLLSSLLPGAAAGLLISRDARRALRKRELRREIEGSTEGPPRRIGGASPPSETS
jgi:hypothetical protein